MRTRPIPFLTLTLALGGLLLAPATGAASKNQQAATATHATPAKKRSGKVKPSQNNSGETTAERERRLYRECKGMPNAGACLGYARR
ncbi:MAG: hypothetical protein LC137_00720 [Burkholderiales bacterium]|nr:hypothetical protein [Burkholderiales bacterium]